MATLVNVFGAARSGSTMLDLMLGNAPDAFSCGEVSAWFRPYRQHHFKLECCCGLHPCPIWKRIGYVRESEFHATVIRELGVDFVIDSSKDLCWLIDAQQWIARGHIRTFNLLVWKDPVDLAYSHWKRGRGRTAWRKEFLGSYGRFFQTAFPFVALNYGALVKDPQRELTAICAAVGTAYRQGRERFWEKEHHYLFGSHEVRRQVQARHSAMKPRPPFPPEFEAERSVLEDEIVSDFDVQQVLRMLKEADVSSRVGSDDISRPPWPKKLSPIWYYWKKATRLLRRYVPERYDPGAP